MLSSNVLNEIACVSGQHDAGAALKADIQKGYKSPTCIWF
jgi:hypothetical protein